MNTTAKATRSHRVNRPACAGGRRLPPPPEHILPPDDQVAPGRRKNPPRGVNREFLIGRWPTGTGPAVTSPVTVSAGPRINQ